jgi:hypothetical protein
MNTNTQNDVEALVISKALYDDVYELYVLVKMMKFGFLSDVESDRMSDLQTSSTTCALVIRMMAGLGANIVIRDYCDDATTQSR